MVCGSAVGAMGCRILWRRLQPQIPQFTRPKSQPTTVENAAETPRSQPAQPGEEGQDTTFTPGVHEALAELKRRRK